MPAITVIPLPDLPEIEQGAPLADLVGDAAEAHAGGLQAGDVLVVTSKVVSKAEGRVVGCDPADPAAKARLVDTESVRVLRRRGDLTISETRHGFVCANAGIDLSNTPEGTAVLLPVDPDRSARKMRDRLAARFGLTSFGVVLSDTFGRPWRNGVTDVAIGVAGFAPVVDLRGTIDGSGRVLDVTEVAVADEVAAAAELVMGKATGNCAAVVRGLTLTGDGSAADMVRSPAEDLFR